MNERTKNLFFETIEMLRKTISKDFYDWKDADDWLFSELNFTKQELLEIYEGRDTMVYIESAV